MCAPLPIDADTAALSRTSGSENAEPAPQRPAILMVDDDPFILEVQSRSLRNLGFDRVSTAASAVAALATLRDRARDPAGAIDIVICDLNMPGMDGIEFLQALKVEQFHVHVVLLSGEGPRILRTVRTLLGDSGLVLLGALQKPLRATTLGALLEGWKPTERASAAPTPLEITEAELVAASLADQWVVHYQPKVDLKTGAVMGVEALVRWQHPRHGLLYPDQFISQAEYCGAIDGLTHCVLHTASQQSVLWRNQGIRLKVAINLSMDSLGSAGFAAKVMAITRACGVEPHDITLEVTESRLMSHSPVPAENLVRLRLQRFQLSIDDFGTGHSSLAQLRDLPFTELKVDRGFVRGARDDHIIRPILEGSIGMAKGLGMIVVAEGVETEEDWHLLRDLGCDLAQGWLIGRPMAAAQLPEWLGQWSTRRRSLVAA